MGWMYGSVSEDTPTGYSIHRKGWRSECCTPDPIAFTGCAPSDFPSTMIQEKRWATGSTIAFFGKNSPIMGTLFGKIQLRACMSYCWLATWGLRSIFDVSYAALIAHCLITNTSIFPKGLGLWIPITLFVVYNIQTLFEHLSTAGVSIRYWWNNQRKSIIGTSTSSFIGFLSGLLKIAGISNAVFDITQKEASTSGAGGDDADAGRFTFDESPVFVAGTTILLVQLTAIIINFLGLNPEASAHSGNECGLGELISSMYLVVCYWPFLKGLFGRGKYGIPISTISKSAVLAFAFVHFSICPSNLGFEILAEIAHVKPHHLK